MQSVTAKFSQPVAVAIAEDTPPVSAALTGQQALLATWLATSQGITTNACPTTAPETATRIRLIGAGAPTGGAWGELISSLARVVGC
jgi:hypothetical protein